MSNAANHQERISEKNCVQLFVDAPVSLVKEALGPLPLQSGLVSEWCAQR